MWGYEEFDKFFGDSFRLWLMEVFWFEIGCKGEMVCVDCVLLMELWVMKGIWSGMWCDC